MHVARSTVAALISTLALTAHAGEAEDIQQLLRAKQFVPAIERADKFLAKSPKDAQVRFLRAIALTETGRNDDAIKAFTKLSEDYPHLPEPYNNLAVLYANNNQFDKARSALQMAIQTNPSYAIAHENMGDLYARLASQAYDKALQLENNNAQIQTKLKLVGTLFNPNQAPSTLAKATTPTKVAIPAATSVPVVVAKAATATPATKVALILPQPTLPTLASVATPTKASPVSPTASPNLKTKTTPIPAPTAAAKERDSDRQQIIASVEGWANAWSKQNVNGYINSYANGFKAPGGRSAWEKDRQSKISGPKSIDVEVNNFKIEFIDEDTAKIKLRQNYKSDRLSSSTTKTLTLKKSGNRWLILEERIGG